jgi:hypothetical protein
MKMAWYGTAIMLGILGMVLFGLCLWTVFIIAAGPKHFYTLWIGVPLLGFVILICLGFAASFYQSRPSVVFRGALGFDPPADITFANSLRHDPIDWDDTYLEFHASDSTISRILRDGFAPIQASEIVEDTYQTPYWWTPPTRPNIRIYATNTGDPHFHDKTWRWSVWHKLLIYDPDGGDAGKRKVYFRYRRP